MMHSCDIRLTASVGDWMMSVLLMACGYEVQLTRMNGCRLLKNGGGLQMMNGGTWTAPASVKTTDDGDVLMSRSW